MSSTNKYKTTSTGTKTAQRPIKVAGYSSFTLHAKRNLRRLEAEARQAECAKRRERTRLGMAVVS